MTADELRLVLDKLEWDDPGNQARALRLEVREALRILGETGATHGLAKGIKVHFLAAQSEIDALRSQLTTSAADLDDMRGQRDAAIAKIEDLVGSLERALAVIHGARP